MTVAAGLHQALKSIQPGRAYDSLLLAASWAIGCCVTGDYIDYWLGRFWGSRLMARFWSQVHARLWPL